MEDTNERQLHAILERIRSTFDNHKGDNPNRWYPEVITERFKKAEPTTRDKVIIEKNLFTLD